MGAHKNSKAQAIREYMKANPEASRQEIATALGFSVELVRNSINQDKRLGMPKLRKRKVRVLKKITHPTSVGIKLDGGYYSLAKLKDIVGALETLSKVTNLA
jgi:hypothetical protein